MKRGATWMLVALTVTLTACSGEDAPPTKHRLTGRVLITPDNRDKAPGSPCTTSTLNSELLIAQGYPIGVDAPDGAILGRGEFGPAFLGG